MGNRISSIKKRIFQKQFLLPQREQYAILKQGDIMKLFENLFSKEELEWINDETMSMEELEELFFDASEDMDIDTWLKQENLSFEELGEKRKTWQKKLLQLAEQFQFNLSDPYGICKEISCVEYYTKELGEFLRLFLAEQGTLLSDSCTEVEVDFIFALPQFEEVERNLSIIEFLAKEWAFFFPQLFEKISVDLPQTNVSTDEIWKITKSFTEKTEKYDTFLHNMESLMSDINNFEPLRKIAPLYIYQVIVKHSSRLQKNKDLTLDLETLFRFKEYEIDQNNGKNFNKSRRYIHLFSELCNLFEKDNMVNIPLSQWGFMKISNLLEFDRGDIELKSTCVVPFFDILLEDSLFSCYEEKEVEAVLEKIWGFSLKKVRYFQSQLAFHPALEGISAYLNENPLIYHEKYLAYCGDTKKIEELCKEIYFFSVAQKIRKPKSDRELKLYCATIYLGLLELNDYFAKEYLVLSLIQKFRRNS